MIDGEISTYGEFHDLIDFSVFLDSDWKTQLTTRITRDVQERNYTEEKAIATFLQSNLREFAEHGAESKRWADVHLYVKADYSVIIESVSTELYDRFGEMLLSEFSPVDLSGMIVAVPTPFQSSMAIDRQALIRHLEFLADHGVERVLMNGTTGEFFSLTPEERKTLLTIARRYFPGVVLFHAGSDSLAQTRIEAHWAEEYGADAVVVLPPYYVAHVEEDGLIDYFNQLGKDLDVPLILYNFPRHTQNPITPHVLRNVEHFGLKDSSKNLDLIPHTPNYYVGGDRFIAEAAAKGAVGFVTGHANYEPETYVAMESALRSGDVDRRADAQRAVDAVLDQIDADGGIAFIKRRIAQYLPGYPTVCRSPLR